ncbi:hypothetical protein CFOL_v3_04082 [Cephalotus follicularis]|uniref:TPR1-like CTLH-containing domain-containing protein n=1 Tax=Cephalotus follicularis TaxID=3775 RepID=A0A1Q3AYA1_CEPFO|nr:hypothetical protein CFOL_v3_04082 [Cephalotus follicularis]
MLFEMRKQKYLEALDNSDRVKALDILMTGLKEFFSDDDHVFRGLTLLLSVNDFRQNELFSTYTDAKSARTNLMTKLKNLIAVNCLLREKVKFPSIPPSRSMHLLQQR